MENQEKYGAPENYVYAGNLSYLITKEILLKEFSSVGEVAQVLLPVNENNIMMGYAFVEMKNKDDVEKAISLLNDKEIEERKIFLAPRAEYEDLWERMFVDGNHV